MLVAKDWRHGRYVYLIVGLLLATAVSLATAYNAQHNWDTVGYVASVHADRGLTGQALKQATYRDLRQSMPAPAYRAIIEKDNPERYAAKVYADPNSLTQQLPFYNIRLAYLTGARAVSGLGMSVTHALRVTQCVYGLLCVLLLLMLCAKLFVSPWFLLAAAPSAGLLPVVQLTTPDAMAAAGLLALAYLIVTDRRIFALGLAALLPLIRTDLIILSLIVAAYMAWRHGLLRPAPIAAVAAVAIYLLLNHVRGNYGYLTILNFTFFNFDPYPADMTLETDLSRYFWLYASNADAFIESPEFFVYVAALAAAAALWTLDGPMRRLADVYLLFCSFLVIHLVLFPQYFPRFFFPIMVVAFITLIVCAKALMRRAGPPPAVRAARRSQADVE